MIEEELGSPEASSLIKILVDGLGELESEGLDLAVTSPETMKEEEDKINNTATEEVRQDGGHEESEQVTDEWDYKEGEEIDEAQPSTTLTTRASLSKPCL